jgi:hypothetical protein
VALFHKAPEFNKYTTFCTVLNNPNYHIGEPPVPPFTLHPVTEDEGSEGDDEDKESTENDDDR